MNKTFTLMVASMFALVLVLSLGSAVSRDAINVTGNNSLINHGDSVVIKFKIDNQETQNISAIKLSLPTFSFGDWQTVKYDSKEYAISNDLVKIENIMIYGHDESKEFELTFKSKEYKKGSETKTLQIDAKNNGTNSYGLKVNPLSMNITIKDTPELTITDLPKLEKTSNGTITLSNKGNVDLTNMDFNQTSFGDFNVTFNNSNTKFGLTAGETKTFQVNSTNAKDLKIGKDNELDFEIISNELGNSNAFSITVPVDFCAYGNDPSGNDLKIDNFDITNLGSGDDNEWNRLDEIEIEVRIENEDDDDKIKDVEVEIRILDENNKDVTRDFLDDEIYDIGSIYEDDDETIIFNLKVSAELEEGDYKLYIKAYSEGNEDTQCVCDSDDFDDEKYYEFEIETDKDFGIDDIYTSKNVNCGSTVTVSFDFYNFDLGEDEDMRLVLYNQELGIKEYSNQFNSDKGEKEELSFEITIPEKMAEKTYKLKIYVEYNYKESTELYRDTSKDEGEIYINIEGNCVLAKPTYITGKYISDVQAGKEMTFSIELFNPTNETMTLTFSSEGYGEWAEFLGTTPGALILLPGETKDVLFKYDLNKDAEGEKIFTIKVTNQNGEVVLEKPVTTSEIEKASLIDIDKEKAKVAGMIALNVVLAILIIFVLVKIFRRR